MNVCSNNESDTFIVDRYVSFSAIELQIFYADS